ncbi:MAG TPA: FtsX-like permease family protein [bacterium]|nr:FtsX-like permease family protein [bacterium]
MSEKIQFSRALKTSVKQMKRSGWLAWASVSVMTLAFLVIQIFLFLAYSTNLFLQFIENKPHIYVFFNPGTEEQTIRDLQEDFQANSSIDFIEYTSEADALTEFKQHNNTSNPIASEAIRENVLPASLAIRLNKIEDAQEIIDLAKIAQANNPEDITNIGFSQEIINNIRDVFLWVRVAGSMILILLLIVIFFFTLLTVEFRMFSRAKEIGIMQLVGGNLWYIRMPFIIEGSIYGGLGAFISTIMVLLVGIFMFIIQAGSPTISFISNFFGDLDWIAITPISLGLVFIISILAGIMLGAFNSVFAIRNYIK